MTWRTASSSSTASESGGDGSPSAEPQRSYPAAAPEDIIGIHSTESEGLGISIAIRRRFEIAMRCV
jgi:hypothetical protein